MRKILINQLFLLLLFWFQEGLFAGLDLYLPLVSSVIALMHLYRLPHRWLTTFFIGSLIEIISGGLSGQLLGLIMIGIFCQTLFSIISHARDRFYVVVVGGLSVLIGEVFSRLSVNIITNKILGGTFDVQELTLQSVISLVIGAMVVLYFGKKIIQPDNRYV